MRTRRTSLLAAIVVLALGAPASAQVVAVSNLGTVNANFSSVVAGGSGSSFTTGVDLFDLNSVDVLLRTSGTGDLTYTAHLYTNVGFVPGSEIATSAASVSLAPSGVGSVLNMDFGSFALGTNTTYWVMITSSGPGTASGSFGVTNDTSEAADPTSPDWLIGNGSYFLAPFNTNGGQTMQFAVNATEITAVPEPGTYAMLGVLGVVGGFYYRRKRARTMAA